MRKHKSPWRASQTLQGLFILGIIHNMNQSILYFHFFHLSLARDKFLATMLDHQNR